MTMIGGPFRRKNKKIALIPSNVRNHIRITDESHNYENKDIKIFKEFNPYPAFIDLHITEITQEAKEEQKRKQLEKLKVIDQYYKDLEAKQQQYLGTILSHNELRQLNLNLIKYATDKR